MRPLQTIAIAVLAAVLMVAASVADIKCPTDAKEGDRVTYEWSSEDGGVTMQRSQERVFYDPQVKMVAVKGNWSQASCNYNLWKIYDFPRSTLFTITEHSCRQDPLDGPFQFDCLPSNTRPNIVRTGFVGAMSSRIPSVLWMMSFMYNTSTAQAVAEWTFSSNPVMAISHSVHDHDLALTVVHYENVVLNVTDPSVFVPPVYCFHSPLLCGPDC